MNAKITLKYAVMLLLILVGGFSSCTSIEIESQESEKQKIDTRAVEFTKTPHFYYYGGERQYLQLNTRYMFVSMANEGIVNMIASLSNVKHQPLRVDIPEEMQSTRSRAVTAHQRFYTVLSFDEEMSEEAYLTKLLEISSLSPDLIVAPYFKNRYSDRIGLSNFFYVKLNDLNDIELLKEKAEKKQTIIVHQNEFMPLWYVLSVTESSNYNAMEMANHFHRSRLFQFAEPDFIVEDEFHCANDQHFGRQWGLRNTGQFGGMGGFDIRACDAWQISTGSGVIVAVLDNGIDLNHPDLRTNIHPLSFDSESGTSPQRLLGTHGTPVAGVIGAVRNNTIGIAGVAPNSRIMSVSNSLAGTPLSRERRANGINWAVQNGADVINNSWGSATRHQILDDAINNAVRNGRNGRGTVVVFSSGNDNSGTVSYPASLPNVIAVGAISPSGQRKSPTSCDGETWWGSNFGTMLDVVAPGVLIPTTAMGGGYMQNFNGTSSAAPHVAGVAALILSVNPTLTAQQVRNIIESTAQRIRPDLHLFSTVQGRPNGTWNNQVGHGLVNAFAAVSAAGGNDVNFNDRTVSSNQTVTGWNIFSRNITVISNATLTFNANSMVTIDAPFTVNNNSQLVITVQ
jgi:subtilisin family serine protease